MIILLIRCFKNQNVNCFTRGQTFEVGMVNQGFFFFFLGEWLLSVLAYSVTQFETHTPWMQHFD